MSDREGLMRNPRGLGVVVAILTMAAGCGGSDGDVAADSRGILATALHLSGSAVALVFQAACGAPAEIDEEGEQSQ